MSGIIDGRKIASEVLANLKKKIHRLKNEAGQTPGLATIIIGDNPASLSFIKIKEKAAQQLGIYFERKDFLEKVLTPEIIDFIQEKNADPKIHGIVAQLPLPDKFNPLQILKTIHPFKDVDALHPKNIGLLFYHQPIFLSPVIKTVQRILREAKINSTKLKGFKVTLVGTGILVGRPLCLWLINQGASVSLCRSTTPDLITQIKSADIVISGTGVPHLITSDMVKTGAVVIDFGFGKLNDKIVGDVDFEEIARKAFVTPTPGGTGPMTAAYLMENVMEAFGRAKNTLKC